MSKKFLNKKIKLIDERNFTMPMENEFRIFEKIMNESKRNFKDKSKRRKEKSNSNSSRDMKIISVLRGKEKITLSTKRLSEFKNFVDLFNCLYYIENGKKHYLITAETIEQFFDNSGFHILYDLDFSSQYNNEFFIELHSIVNANEIKTMNEFCKFHEIYFRRINHPYFYTALWSAKRILKYYRLNEKNNTKRNEKFEKCSNSRITKFYGPFGTGKTTLLYSFFKTISYVPISVNSNDDIDYSKKNSINIKDIKLKKNSQIDIKKYKNAFEDNIEVDDKLSLSYSSEEQSRDPNESNNIIDLEEKENSSDIETKENKELKSIISSFYEKEYEDNDSTEDQYSFLSSLYVDLEKEKTKELSEFNQKYFE